MTQQYSRWQDLQKQPGSARPAQIEELRLRVHQFVIDEVGPKLSDENVEPDELRRLVQEQVHQALSEEHIALSAAERAQLIQDVTDDALGYGPIDRPPVRLGLRGGLHHADPMVSELERRDRAR